MIEGTEATQPPIVKVKFGTKNHTCNVQESTAAYVTDYLDDYVGKDAPLEKPAAWLDLRNMTYEQYVAKVRARYKNRTSSALYNASKAEQRGYICKPFVRKLFTPDIIGITHSKSVRSGGPRSGFLLETLEEIGGPPSAYYPYNLPVCPVHYSIFWGIFWPEPGHMEGDILTNERLVGYMHLRRTGNLAIYTQLLGHGDHLSYGIMFHLHLTIVKWILDENNPHGRGLDHLIYGRYYDGGEGRIFWRKKTCFVPAYLIHLGKKRGN